MFTLHSRSSSPAAALSLQGFDSSAPVAEPVVEREVGVGVVAAGKQLARGKGVSPLHGRRPVRGDPGGVFPGACAAAHRVFGHMFSAWAEHPTGIQGKAVSGEVATKAREPALGHADGNCHRASRAAQAQTMAMPLRRTAKHMLATERATAEY